MSPGRAATLVLLPGLDGTGRLFDAFVAALDPSIEPAVHAYPMGEPLDHAALADRVAASPPVDGPWVLLGESFSGPVAIDVASRRPPGLVGLALACTFASCPRPRLGALLPLVPDALLRAPPTVALRALVGDGVDDGTVGVIRSAIADVSAATVRARLESIVGVDVRAKAARVAVSCLALSAHRDPLVPRAATDDLAGRLPRVTERRIGRSHFLLQVHPMDAARAVGEFVAERVADGAREA